jgi:predicted metalloprotease with PDZ domain
MNRKPILYSLEPFDPAGHRVRATVTVAEPTPSGQIISMPAWIPGSYLIRDFARQVEVITARCGRQSLNIKKVDNHTWRVAPCQGALTVTAEIYAWDLSVRGAHLDESHGFFNGTSVFLKPLGHESTPCELTLLPPPGRLGWSVHTSMPLRARAQNTLSTKGFSVYAVNDYDALIDHPIEMGRPQVARFRACGAPHELVFTGVIPGLDLQRLIRDIKRICEEQIRFFEPSTARAPFLDGASKYVFMTMVTGDSYGGLEHRASTALMAARKDLPTIGQEKTSEGYQTFLGLVSHEYFHTWNVKRIKPAAFAPYNLTKENYTELLWIFEGFTSYYDDLFLLRSGLIDQPTYLKTLGKQIATVWASPGRTKQSVAESSFDAWTRYYKQDENSPNALVSYYTKGSLVALALDLSIRHHTQEQRSLDDVMRLMWARFGRDFYTGEARGLREQEFPNLVREATGVDLRTEIQAWAYGHNDIPLAKLFAQHGITMQWSAASKAPSTGMRIRKQGEHQVIATVLQHGPAHQAGLSANDILVAVNGLKIDSALNTFDALLAHYQPGDRLNIHVFRRDELRHFELTLAAPSLSECKLTAATKP